MILRPATQEDIPAMHRIRLAVRENALSDPNRITHEDYLGALDVHGKTWVVELDAQIRAFATGYRNGSIWALFVQPEYEGLGFAKRLLAEATSWLWSIGHHSIWLETGANTRAERFYLAQGWRPIGVAAGGDIRLSLPRPESICK